MERKLIGSPPEGLKWEVIQSYAGSRYTKSLMFSPSSLDECREVLSFAKANGLAICPKGGGFTFGDMILNDGGIILDLSRMNAVKSWDTESGRIVVESGVTLLTIFRTALPDNWVLASNPGGLSITIGGAVSNNVHGKDSFKAGNFGDQIVSMKVLTTEGTIVTVDNTPGNPLVEALIGGMGLIGIIVEITLQLKKVPSPYVEVTTLSVRNSGELIDAMEAAREDSDFLVSWVDAFSTGSALGRGIITKARWVEHEGNQAEANEHLRSLKTPTHLFGIMPIGPAYAAIKPFTRPFFNRLANVMNYKIHEASCPAHKPKRELSLFTKYNFSLHSNIPKFNLIFKPHGFVEIQALIPRSAGLEAINEILRLCQKHSCQSFLCGLKLHRPDNNMISFAGEGYSISIDVQLRWVALSRLNEFSSVVLNYICDVGGKVFLAKDEILPKEIFRKMYPRYTEFVEIKRKMDSGSILRSDMYHRLLA